MESIVIQVPSKSDLKLLLALADKLGFRSFSVTEKEARMLARQKMAAIVEGVETSEEPTMEEINGIVKQVRTRRYAQGHQSSH